MKKLIAAFSLVVCAACFIFVKASSAAYETGEVYVCEQNKTYAEIAARIVATSYSMQRAGYCTCAQVPPYNYERVRKGKWAKEGFEYEYGNCEAPKDKVFRCFCVGNSPMDN